MALDFSVRRSLLYLRDTKSDEASAHLSAQLQLMRAYHGANPHKSAPAKAWTSWLTCQYSYNISEYYKYQLRRICIKRINTFCQKCAAHEEKREEEGRAGGRGRFCGSV